jgi:hypothetical protein
VALCASDLWLMSGLVLRSTRGILGLKSVYGFDYLDGQSSGQRPLESTMSAHQLLV